MLPPLTRRRAHRLIDRIALVQIRRPQCKSKFAPPEDLPIATWYLKCRTDAPGTRQLPLQSSSSWMARAEHVSPMYWKVTGPVLKAEMTGHYSEAAVFRFF